MRVNMGLSVLALAASLAASHAQAAVALAAHRASYNISLAAGDGAQAPVSASGLIAYEFRGSSCEGYASNFRQVTVLQKSEGAPISADTKSTMFEDGQGRSLQFQVDSSASDSPADPIEGKAARSDAGEISVDLAKPTPQKLDLGKDILFPTQHIAKIIDSARSGASTLQARVFDGSDTGSKIFDTLTVIGKVGAGPPEDAANAEALKGVARWPVTISYFDAAKKDAPAEYILTFDLYENGVSGSLKLDYGTFALAAHLVQIELLPADGASCAN
jgi:EipB-like